MYYTDLPFYNRFARIDRYYGETIWTEMLPMVCAELDPDRPYRVSSPYSERGLDPNDMYIGDRHSWDNRWRNFYNDKTKFASEYGLQSAPNIESVTEYLPEANHRHPLWAWHSNSANRGNEPFFDALREYYIRDPEILPTKDFIHYTQWAQGESLRISFEHYRRRKFICGGALTWMYTDSWGTVGWTVVDYYLRRKASYYHVKRGFAAILPSMVRDGDDVALCVSLWMTNDTLENLQGSLTVWEIPFNGTKANKIYCEPCAVPANASLYCGKLPQPSGGDRCLYAEFTVASAVFENWYFPDEWVRLNVPVACPVWKVEKEQSETWLLRVKSDVFVRNFMVNEESIAWIEDNAFYVNPCREKIVRLIPKNAKTFIKPEAYWL
jgi:hypothetical protein